MLDPRDSLAAKLGWAHALISLLVALIASLWIADTTRDRIESAAGHVFEQYAAQISDEIDAQLNGKLQGLGATAAMLGQLPASIRAGDADSLLGEFRRQLPEFQWIALVSPDGRLLASAGDQHALPAFGAEAWLREGSRAPTVDDSSWRPAPRGGDRSGFLRMAAPVRTPAGELVGILAAQLSLDWVKSFGNQLIDSLRAQRMVQVLVINDDGVVLFGPDPLLGTAIAGQPVPDVARAAGSLQALRSDGTARRDTNPTGHLVLDWPDDRRPYLSGWALSDGYGRFQGLGWTVWVREPMDRAYRIIRDQQLRALVFVLVFGLLIVAVGLLVTRQLTRHLSGIARSADDIRAGRRTDLEVSTGRDEAARIGHSLQALLGDLQARSHALQQLNRELDARVAERSREIERLADENRHAALMRERLKLARDLHDTLAQSLMSLLAEIRLLRKLAGGDPQTLRDELERAEQAAQEGLREAREAIVQLRQHPVRDTGLGPALEQLAWRAGERSGLQIGITVDPTLAGLADRRAEIVHRVAEEALRNVQRHAHAQQVSMRLERTTIDNIASLQLSIEDDGIGFEPARLPGGEHFGIQGMHEQADLVAGCLRIDTAIGEGTRVSLTMPL